MIDLNYLNDFPKSFSKEASQLKQILSIYNEMKAEVTFIKSAVEVEGKSTESLGKSIITSAKTFYSEAALASDDLTHLLKLEQIFIMMFDQISNESQSGLTVNQVTKTFSEIGEDISDFTRGTSENLIALVRDLNNARIKYKNLFIKTEKSFKDLEQNFLSKKKVEADDKHSYNQTMKDKIEDKILNILNEFEENKNSLISSFDECKRLEVVLNEMIKNAFTNSIRFLVNSINNFKNLLSNVCEGKSSSLNKCKNEFIFKSMESLNQIELDFNNQELRYNEIKGIKSEFGLFMNLFNLNRENQNLTQNSINIQNSINPNQSLNQNLPTNQSTNMNESIISDASANSSNNSQYSISEISQIIEENFNKNNYTTSLFTDNLLSYLYVFNQSVTLRKKHLSSFLKFIQDYIKSLENFVSISNKLIKGLALPKVVILNYCPFIIQIQEFLRSLTELIIRKEEENIKILITTLQSPLEHILMKDLSSDEAIINGVYQKIQKEYSNFKTNLNKLLQNKEKVSQNLEKVKENIHKNSDDVNSFAKFEKQFLSLRAEEGNLNEACLDAYKKYRKFIEECLEILRKTILSYKEKEFNKTKEFKENLINFLKFKEKNFNQISEFLGYKDQIPMENSSILKSLNLIYSSYNKEFDLGMDEKILNDVFNEIISSTTTESSIKSLGLSREIQNSLKDIIYMNKEEIIPSKEFNLNDFISPEELNSYKEKLNFLKNNARRISVKNISTNRKKFDDIFYIDQDENFIDNFSCALSDKILVQGKLYITNKKLVFYSWFNNSTLFGKTLIEIPKEEIVEVEKHKNLLFDNMIYVKTKTTQFLFASFINRDKCYYVIREVFFGEKNPLEESKTLESTQVPKPEEINRDGREGLNLNLSHISEDNIVEKHNKDNLSVDAGDIQNNKSSSNIEIKIAHKKSKSENTSPLKMTKKENLELEIEKNQEDEKLNLNKFNEVINEVNLSRKNTEENLNLINNLNSSRISFSPEKEEYSQKREENLNLNLNLNENVIDTQVQVPQIISKTDIISKIATFNKSQLEIFNTQNKRNFQATFINNHKLGDIPLPFIYNSLYDPDSPCPEMGSSKSFNISFLELRKDYAINFSKIDNPSWDSLIPKYFKNKDNYIHSIFEDKNLGNQFINEELVNPTGEINKIEYKYAYTHPILKKKFMGPSKLEVEDNFKIYFLSPSCLIVEIFSYMSGFMMMDTFYTILQYRYDSVPQYNQPVDKVEYETSLSVNLEIVFIKENWFKAKIQGEAQADMDESIKGTVLPNISKVLNSQREKYLKSLEEYKRKMQEEKSSLNLNLNLEAQPILNIENLNVKPEEEDAYRIIDRTSQFGFSEKEEQKNLEETLLKEKNLKEEKEKAPQITQPCKEIEIIQPQSEMNELLELIQTTSKEKSVLLFTFIFFMFIYFLFMPSHASLTMFVNLILFLFIVLKLNRIERKVDYMYQHVSKVKSE
jgi:hypothetical protein